MTIDAAAIFRLHSGPGTEFVYDKPVFDADDLEVITFSDTGVATTRTRGGGGTYDYVVSGSYDTASSRYPSGVTVTLNTSLPADWQVLIRNAPALAQETDYQDGGPLPMERLETDLDRLMVLAQWLADKTDRSLRVPFLSGTDVELPPFEANKLLGTGDTGFEFREASDLSSTNVTPTGYSAQNLADALGDIKDDIGVLETTAGTLGGLATGDDAGDVPFTPAGTIAASTVQAAIEELDSEVDARLDTLEGRPLLTDVMIFRDEKTSGTPGGEFSNAAPVVRTLNTTQGSITGVTLGANTITFAAGTYEIEAEAPAFQVGNHQAYLYNTSGAAVLARGTSTYSNSASSANGQTSSIVRAVLTFASSTTVQLWHEGQTTKATDGLGRAGSFGTEVYAQVRVRKLA